MAQNAEAVRENPILMATQQPRQCMGIPPTYQRDQFFVRIHSPIRADRTRRTRVYTWVRIRAAVGWWWNSRQAPPFAGIVRGTRRRERQMVPRSSLHCWGNGNFTYWAISRSMQIAITITVPLCSMWAVMDGMIDCRHSRIIANTKPSEITGPSRTNS